MFKTKSVTKTDINLRLNTNQSDFTLVQNQPMRAVGTYQVKESSRWQPKTQEHRDKIWET